MICEIAEGSTFLMDWALLTVLGVISTMIMSGYVFWVYYVNVTYDKWRNKTNPQFPSPEKVRSEIIQMFKGIVAGTLPAALSIFLTKHGIINSYCGIKHGWMFELKNFFIVWILSDFYEWAYHYAGHYFDAMWTIHKHHHKFYNPSPFAVIADEYVDMFCRGMPLVLLPWLFHVNLDILFLQYAAMFYGYGIYLHWGYETPHIISAHNPIVNTSFQHYIHHAKSIKNRPIHCGFFIKLWDQLAGATYEQDPKRTARNLVLECPCAECCQNRGERTEEAYCKIIKPDYSPLLTYKFWVDGLLKDERLSESLKNLFKYD